MLDHPRQTDQVSRFAEPSSDPARQIDRDLDGFIQDMGELLTRSSNPHLDLHSVLATKIVLRYIETQPLTPDALVELVSSLRAALHNGSLKQARLPAVPIDQSVTADYLICLEDGHQCKSLQRYLKHKFQLSPHAYRLRWGLPADYPMVAENYSRHRSYLARSHQLGRYERNKPRV